MITAHDASWKSLTHRKYMITYYTVHAPTSQLNHNTQFYNKDNYIVQNIQVEKTSKNGRIKCINFPFPTFDIIIFKCEILVIVQEIQTHVHILSQYLPGLS